MTLRDEVQKDLPTQCKTCRILKGPDVELATELQELLGEEFPAAHLAKALRKRGFQISNNSVQRHRAEHMQ